MEEEEEGGGCGGNIDRLPEECISHVLSLTSTRDSCRSAAVSVAFRSAVDCDTVWERFLPPDYRQILERAVDPPVEYSSKRELYFRLCDPILIDGGMMSFQVEKASGAKCYMISARELTIIRGSTPDYWEWISVADSRFAEVAHLLLVWWLEISGRIESRMLSPKTNYAAYLIFKLDEETWGLDLSDPPQEASFSVGGQESINIVRVQPAEPERPRVAGETRLPSTRADGWMEVEMGEFFNEDGEDGVVDLRLWEVTGGQEKRGLTVLGIEVRPKTN